MAAHLASENHYVMLRVCYSKCYVETNGIGADDIYIGGVAIYHDFRTKTFNVKLGEFDSEDSMDKNIKAFGMSMWGGDEIEITLVDGKKIKPFYHNPRISGYSKFFGAVVVIAEADFGGFGSWITDKLHPFVKSKAMKCKNNLLNLWTTTRPSVDSISDCLNNSFKDMQTNDLALSALLAGGPLIGDDIFRPETPLIFTHTNSYIEFPDNIQGDHPTNTTNRERVFTRPQIGDDAKYKLWLDFRMYR